jgi:hypothetical protein
MVEKDKLTSEKVKFSGLFDFKDTYQFVYAWLTEEGYSVEEQKYQESVKGDSKDVEIAWDCKKKISDYFRANLKVSWRVLGLKKVEAEKNGKRIKIDDGSFEIKISGTLERDYQNKWDKSQGLRFLRGVYDKYIIEGSLKQYRGKVVGDVDDLIEEVKAFLAITGLK